MKRIIALLLLPGAALHTEAQAQSVTLAKYNGEHTSPRPAALATDRIIVRWRGADSNAGGTGEATRKLTATSGLQLRHQRSMSNGAELLQLDRRLSGAELDAAIERLQADPNVIYAAPDLRRHAHA